MIKLIYVRVANDMKLCAFVYLASILFVSLTFMIVEDFEFPRAVWFSFITSLTIGYGDVSPATILGKFFTILFAIQWILFIIPCFLVNMIDIARRDKDKFSHEEQEQVKKDLDLLRQQNAAQLIILQDLRDRYLSKQ